MLCEAVCGLELTLSGDRLVGVRGDRRDPFSRGHVCPKAAALPDITHDPDRIRKPQRRIGDRWYEVSWQEALAEAGERLAEIQKTHGRSAVGLYLGNPTVHSYSGLLAATLLSRALGSRARFSATSVDQLPHMLASLEMFGHQLLLPVPDIDRCQHLLVLGANPLASNGSLFTAGGIKRRIEALRRRGGTMVVVDPRRTETAALADQHHFLRPGGDAFLLLAMLHTIFAEGRERPGRLEPWLEDLSRLRRLVSPFPPERVADRCGLGPDVIRALARDFAAASSAACHGRVGVCTQEFGGVAAWLVMVLNIVTGNLDRPGGLMFTTPAVDLVGLATRLGQRGHFGAWKTRVRGLPEFGGELPCATLAEEMDTPGAGQIRGFITFAGNPVLSTPNGARLEQALARLDFMVSVDIYRNETTRHAHLLLPTQFGPERDHYDLTFHALAVRNTARYVRAAVPPPPGVRSDWDVLLDLARALRTSGGGRPGLGLGLRLRALQRLGPRRILDLLLRTGPHGALRGGRLSLAELQRHPHGIDLGPLQPRLPGLLASTGGAIHLVPDRFASDLARLERELANPPAPGLVLIGRRHLRSNNSWMHNSARLVKGRDRCTLLMHPQDARARALANGATALLSSRQGRALVTLELSEDICPGVVSLPHGFGHHRDGSRLQVARRHAGVSFNDLSDESIVDPLSGTAVLNGIPVEVTAAAPDGQPGNG
jgi:anaerobic selenocysteine-containing dehydrogenase